MIAAKQTTKQTVHTTHHLQASADSIWEIISSADDVDHWLPLISSCRLDGQGAGAKRICGSESGDLLETIIKIDHENRVFQYSIDQQSLLPVENIVATMIVSEIDGVTTLEWIFDCTMNDASQKKLVQQAITQVYASGASGLDQLAQAA